MQSIQCTGFTAAGVAAGLKKNGSKDLGLIYSTVPASAAGVFTRNRVQAAPVILDRQRLRAGTAQAIIVNSGNANCCTGPQGFDAAESMAKFTATGLRIPEAHVLVSSTGVIGQPLPIERVEAAVPGLIHSLHPDGFDDFSTAIMTTDTVPKIAARQAALEGGRFSIIGVAKGAGMICPDMATMLCFLCTDAQVDPYLLKDSLSIAVSRSFNRITIDGDTSTNDTVLILANGLSGISIRTDEYRLVFQNLLDGILVELAKKIIKDAEGATKLVEIIVRGAPTPDSAVRVARTVANSNLVKTAFFGEDANWGRILAAAGRAGVSIDPNRVDVFFDKERMVRGGIGCGVEAESRATEVLKQPEFSVTIDLNLGTASHTVYTCDFSIDYVKINADYRS